MLIFCHKHKEQGTDSCGSCDEENPTLENVMRVLITVKHKDFTDDDNMSVQTAAETLEWDLKKMLFVSGLCRLFLFGY